MSQYFLQYCQDTFLMFGSQKWQLLKWHEFFREKITAPFLKQDVKVKKIN